jgi:hypothetical protein
MKIFRTLLMLFWKDEMSRNMMAVMETVIVVDGISPGDS